MTIKKVLDTTAHRPWALPTETWKYYQEWNRAIFLHWQVDHDELIPFVPKKLQIDLFDDKPWVSLVAFTMEGTRLKNLPTFPPISNFHEINIRTYVTQNNKAGVYFLSIEGGTKISCQIASRLSGLPYRYSPMDRKGNHYQSFNIKYSDSFKMEYEVGKELNQKTEQDIWLTERYALFQDNKELIYEYEIHHLEWPIYTIDLKGLKVEYPRFDKLLHNRPDQMHYSNGVRVMAWDKKII